MDRMPTLISPTGHRVWRGPLGLVGLLLLLGLGPTSGLHAQSIRGQVLDASSGAPIPSASVVALEPLAGDSAAVVGEVITDVDGRFTLRLPRPMEVLLTASVIGYRVSEPARVRVDTNLELVDVEIRLSQEAVELDGLTVTARGVELRHRRSVEGFRERYKTRLPVGNSKLVMGNEPIARASADMDVLMRNLLVDPLGCIVTYRDGIHVPPVGLVEPWMGRSSRRPPIFLDAGAPPMLDVVGVEFYRHRVDAPLELRDRRGPCALAGDFSVIAYWTGTPDPVIDPSRIELRIQDEATGTPLNARVFLEGSDGTLELAGEATGGVAKIDLPGDPSVTLVARSGGYFDSAPLLLTTEDRELGVAFIWMRHMDPAKRIDAVMEARAAEAEAAGGVDVVATAQPREVAVKVRDGSGDPLDAVQVWADTIPLGITDGSGFFRTTLDEPIATEIRLTRLGLGEVSTMINLSQTGEGVLLQTTMLPEAIELEPITVTAVPRELLADVQSIQTSIRLGRGRFVAREEIETRAYPPVAMLVQGQPGIELRNGVPFSRRAPECGAMAVFLDGVLTPGAEDFLRTSSMDVELVEVYAGGGSVPARYQVGTTRCGVLAVWTRRGGDVQLSDLLEFDRRTGGRDEGGGR